MRFKLIYRMCLGLILTLWAAMPIFAQAQGNALWKPMKHSYDINPGSALDFTFLLDAPAGKHGAVLITNGHFAFAQKPGERVRFYGNNIGLEGITKPECEKLAERFARMGYNAARIHVYDQDLQGKKNPSTAVDPVQEDILDYLIDCMKRRGIYLTIDLYVARVIFPNEIAGIPNALQHAYKMLVHLHEPSLENWKRWADRILGHTNRYTGLALKDEPALYGISLINEDTPYHQIKNFPGVSALYQKSFEAWKESNPASGRGEEDLFRIFVTETYIASYKRMMAYLKSIGVKQPLTGVNFMEHQFQAFIRTELDYVDEHYYFDHPHLTGEDPYGPAKVHGKPNEKWDADNPRYAFSTRVFGKPFTLSEWNQVYPNPSRASSGPIMAAYALLQDWDGLLRFKYAANPYSMDKGVNVPHSYTGEVFAISVDPVNLLSDKIGILLFRRGELAPALAALPYAVTEKSFAPGKDPRSFFPEPYTRMGLVVRTGSVVTRGVLENVPFAVNDKVDRVTPSGSGFLLPADKNLFREAASRGILKGGIIDEVNGLFQSDTGEIRLNNRLCRFSAVSPKTEVFSIEGKVDVKNEVKGKLISVESLESGTTEGNENNYAVIAVSALDGDKGLAECSKLLIFLLTDVRASGLSLASGPITEYQKHGSLPHLVRTAKAKLRLASGSFSSATVYPLSMSGERLGGMAATSLENSFLIPLTTDPGENGSLVFEMIRK